MEHCRLMHDKQKIGNIGEELACEYLVKHGYRVLGRNIRGRGWELDIVAQSKDKTLVFVEVKALSARAGETILSPEDHFTRSKFIKTKRACEMFIGQNDELIKEKKGWRIDLIALTVDQDGKAKEFRHYENVSIPGT